MKSILLTEQNVLDIYKKLISRQEVSQEELDQVLVRFNELAGVQK